MIVLRFIIAIIFNLLFFSNSFATCNHSQVTAALALTLGQVDCNDNDSFTVLLGVTFEKDTDDVVEAQNTDGVTIVNNGTIKNEEYGSQAPIDGSATRNLTVTNNGTITAMKRYGIYIEDAEQVTITNNAGAIIQTDYNSTASHELGAIYGNNIGNCASGDCYNSSDSNGGAGLTLHNYGTIISNYRTIWGGNNDGTKSRNVKIYNYDGGSITAETSATFKFRNVEDFELYNYIGATLESGTVDATAADFVVDVVDGEDVVIDNDGTITSGKRYAISCDECENFTLDNSGVIEATGDTVYARNLTGTNSITNSGTIKNTSTGRPVQLKGGSGITFTNTGTIESVTQVAVDFTDSIDPTIINRGTIKSTVNKAKVIDFPQTAATGSGGTLENYGTIINDTGSSGQSIRLGDATATWNNMKIINSGTISSVGESILVSGGSETTGLNITTKGEGTWVGEIDMESAAVTMTLDCSISKDQDIEIEDKTNMVIVNNLCGNDTYEILDSNKNADADNSETDGYLRIYGEDLDIAQDNVLYRSENVLSKLRAILGPAIHAFHNTRRRAEYTDNISGAVGYFNSNNSSPAASDYFIGYADQRVSFFNSEYRGGENIALGINKKFTANQFSYYITPLIGYEDLKITDVETEGNQAVNTSLTSQFIGLDAGIGREMTVNERNRTSFKMRATYGAQRFPDYTASFEDGELLVENSIDQVLGAGFEIRNALGIDRNMQLYVGGNWNETLSDEIKITADGENKNVSPEMQNALGHYVGIDIKATIKGFDLNFNMQSGATGGLTDQVAILSLFKSF